MEGGSRGCFVLWYIDVEPPAARERGGILTTVMAPRSSTPRLDSTSFLPSLTNKRKYIPLDRPIALPPILIPIQAFTALA